MLGTASDQPFQPLVHSLVHSAAGLLGLIASKYQRFSVRAYTFHNVDYALETIQVALLPRPQVSKFEEGEGRGRGRGLCARARYTLHTAPDPLLPQKYQIARMHAKF
jgi:hypothetical protein